jgi:hypothetical protein
MKSFLMLIEIKNRYRRYFASLSETTDELIIEGMKAAKSLS